MFLMLEQKPRMIKSMPSPGICHPILKASNPLKSLKAEGQTGEATEKDSASEKSVPSR